MNPKILAALNKQINREFYASYLYLSMSAYFESINLPGTAKWMRLQAQEETTHAMKIFDYIHARGGKVILEQIDKPNVEWNSPLEAFQAALAHEQKVTRWIGDLVELAITEKDHATNSFLQWYVNEQVEEEEQVTIIIEQLKLVGDNGPARIMFDAQLAQRS